MSLQILTLLRYQYRRYTHLSALIVWESDLEYGCYDTHGLAMLRIIPAQCRLPSEHRL